jgi:hypothetical protein
VLLFQLLKKFRKFVLNFAEHDESDAITCNKGDDDQREDDFYG